MKGFFYSLGQLHINFPPWPVSLRTGQTISVSTPEIHFQIVVTQLHHSVIHSKTSFFSEYTLLSSFSAHILFPKRWPPNGLFKGLSSSKETLWVHCIMWNRKFTFKNSSWWRPANYLHLTQATDCLTIKTQMLFCLIRVSSPFILRLYDCSEELNNIDKIFIFGEISQVIVGYFWHHTGCTALLMVIIFLLIRWSSKIMQWKALVL